MRPCLEAMALFGSGVTLFRLGSQQLLPFLEPWRQFVPLMVWGWFGVGLGLA